MGPPDAVRFLFDVLVIIVLGATYVAGLTLLTLVEAIRNTARSPRDAGGDASGRNRDVDPTR